MTDKIIVKQSGAIARIIFNQPEKRNAVSLEMWEAVEVALDKFAADKDVRVLILSGAGGKAFVSGADISKFESERASADGVARYNATTKRVYDKVEAFPKPTIAQIDGFLRRRRHGACRMLRYSYLRAGIKFCHSGSAAWAWLWVPWD